MASSRDRQRKLARAKFDRQMARRAAAARRKRRIQAGIGSVVTLLLIVLGSVWALGGFDHEPERTSAEEQCIWATQDSGANANLKDVGEPPTSGLPTTGTRPMTITTNQGAPITIQLDLENAPCAGASFAYLAGKGFFDNTKCHEITSEGAVRCGDPSGTGQGGPTYSYYNENVPESTAPSPSASASASPSTGSSASPSASPSPAAPAYPAGTVAVIGNPPGNNGSQFLIFFQDFNPPQPDYSIIGKVVAGMDVVKHIGALETVENDSGAKVKPKTDVIIQSLTVGEPTSATPSTTPSATPSAAAPGQTGTPTPAGKS